MGIRRALVLGGGGTTGIAWETGLVASLIDSGIDLLQADLIVGTSAGSTVAAQLASGVNPMELYERQLDPTLGEPPVDADLEAVLSHISALLTAGSCPDAARRLVGSFARTVSPSVRERRRALIERRLTSHEWPEKRLAITSVDADTGELVVLEASTGIPITDAVAASSAIPGIWPTVSWAGRELIDGGVRSPTNTDVAHGYDAVLVVAPSSRFPESADVAEVSSARRVEPDDAYRALRLSVLDPGVRSIAARDGWRRGRQIARDIEDWWQ